MKPIVTFVLIAGLLLFALGGGAEPAFAGDTYKFNPPQNYIGSWHDEDHWLILDNGNFVPAKDWPDGDDHVIIDVPFETPAQYCEIVADDAACRTLKVDAGGVIRVIGQRFTIGEAAETTTSVVNGQIEMYYNGAAMAFVAVHGDVELEGQDGIFPEGESCITASVLLIPSIESRYPDADPRGIVHGVYGPENLLLDEDFNLNGNLSVRINVQHNGGPSGTFLDEDTMTFGLPGLQDPDFELSGSDEVTAVRGRVRFQSLRFGATAPLWHIFPDGVIEVTIDADASYYEDVPFDIVFAKGGDLELWHDFSSLGTLTAVGDEGSVSRIFVLWGKVATWRTP
jgi:hypothetical protein